MTCDPENNQCQQGFWHMTKMYEGSNSLRLYLEFMSMIYIVKKWDRRLWLIECLVLPIWFYLDQVHVLFAYIGHAYVEKDPHDIEPINWRFSIISVNKIDSLTNCLDGHYIA